MIRFVCNCGQDFEVPADQAGTSFQCPACGLLVDVPTISELSAISEDGTYKVDLSPPEKTRRDELAEMQRAYTRQRVDEFGNELDLRPTEDQFAHIGEPSTDELADGANAGAAAHAAPKYDPITGELIRPIDIRTDQPRIDPSAIPVAKAVINYARRDTVGVFHGGRILPELFRFTNVVVMSVVFFAHVMLQFLALPILIGMWLLVPAWMLVAGLILAHYACVVNEIATEDRDELPRPLRDLSWTDDLWGAFVHFAAALILCYGWVIVTHWLPAHLSRAVVGAVAIVGTILFPAVFLTLTTSGSIINLTPDRIFRVITVLGGKYLLCVVFWLIAGGIYVLASFFANVMSLIGLLTPPGTFTKLEAPPMMAVYPVLGLGIVLMHAFCWYLGLMYRGHHEGFDWAFQRHIPGTTPARPTPKRGFAVVSKQNAAKPRPVQPIAPAANAPTPVIPIARNERE